jgi:hypothetical protein
MSTILVMLLAVPLPPQGNVCVTGRVEPLPGPTICMQGETHRLECAGVWLKSSVVNLASFVGQIVEVSGPDVSAFPTCPPLIDVVAVQSPPPATLEWCGSGSTCCPIKFKVCPGGLGIWSLFLSTSPAYLPLGCGWPIDGTATIALPAFPIGGGILGASCGVVSFQIPCENALVGAQVWLQGTRRDIGPVGPLQLTNPICLTITPFLPPCAPVGC